MRNYTNIYVMKLTNQKKGDSKHEKDISICKEMQEKRDIPGS